MKTRTAPWDYERRIKPPTPFAQRACPKCGKMVDSACAGDGIMYWCPDDGKIVKKDVDPRTPEERANDDDYTDQKNTVDNILDQRVRRKWTRPKPKSR